jgi:hypothetical protein
MIRSLVLWFSGALGELSRSAIPLHFHGHEELRLLRELPAAAVPGDDAHV